MARLKWISASVLIVCLLIAGGLGYYILFGSYSEGTRSGRLIKISNKGFLIKTWEGEIDVGGISTSPGRRNGLNVSSTWAFSVDGDRKDLLAELERLSGADVRLHYEERFVRLFWRGDTKYFVTKVERR